MNKAMIRYILGYVLSILALLLLLPCLVALTYQEMEGFHYLAVAAFGGYVKAQLILSVVIFFILLAIVAIGVSIHTALTQQNGTPYLIISTLEEDWIYPLDRNQKLCIPGAIGESHIEIKNGSAFFIDSPCDNKICVMSQPISRSGEWIACLPNQIFIRIEGKMPQHSLDATSF